jgi:L-lactate dehydrogenase complex protein LldG
MLKKTELPRMTERDKIFARIGEALKTQASSGHGEGHAQESFSGSIQNLNARQWLPRVGEGFEERIDLFRKNASDLRAEFHLVDNLQEASKLLLGLSAAEAWRKIGCHAGELTDAMQRQLGLAICKTDEPYSVGELENCDAAITECDALIAQTGSVLVTSRSAGGRALSVLPPHHIVIAKRSQLVGDLTDAFVLIKEKYGGNYPSFISFITGPSRTGDIERVLVLGAHGPKKLTIVCF